jgi:ABC-2 type transport system permease protein
MRNIWVIAEKEYKHFFISPIAYVMALALLLIVGILFYINILAASLQQYAPGVEVILSPMVTLLLFMTPAITMRSIAEENKSGTMEILLTSPVRDWEVVVGKWLGGLLLMGTLLLITWFFPIVLNQMIKPGIDQGVMLTGYLGIFLLSGAFLAIGVWISSLFSNPIAAFLGTLGFSLVFWLIGLFQQASGASGDSLLTYLSLNEHFYNTFMRGIIDLKDVVYYLSVIILALFLGTMSVEARRWR